MTVPATVAFSRIYVAFAAGYVMSYVFRVVTAVISPELTRELDLNPGALGLLTSTYFVAFAAMQIPAGLLLDRYGPRRVEPVLLVVAAIGAFAFAAADVASGLALRARVDRRRRVGVPDGAAQGHRGLVRPERQASMTGWVMVAGSSGALFATLPVEDRAALRGLAHAVRGVRRR